MTISYRGLKKTAKVVVLNGDILGSYETKFTTIPEIEEDDDTDDPYGEYEVYALSAPVKKFDKLIINSLDDIKKNINDEGRHVLSLYRDKELVETVISARKNLKGECSLGLYVKDNVLGVGTMTYYDLKTKKFASLGHGAIDGSVRNGILTKSYVSGITKGIRGVPGEKKAYLDNKELGVITDNNDFGVFGNLTNSKITGKVENELIKVASRSEVHTGKAIITTVLTGDKKENFEVNIIEVKNQNYPDIKGIKFEVTDQNLLERTGGIIQGMSGSPIVQDGVLVGAVSHVLVEDSKTGYGVFAEFMLNYT